MACCTQTALSVIFMPIKPDCLRNSLPKSQLPIEEVTLPVALSTHSSPNPPSVGSFWQKVPILQKPPLLSPLSFHSFTQGWKIKRVEMRKQQLGAKTLQQGRERPSKPPDKRGDTATSISHKVFPMLSLHTTTSIFRQPINGIKQKERINVTRILVMQQRKERKKKTCSKPSFGQCFYNYFGFWQLKVLHLYWFSTMHEWILLFYC